MKVKPKFLQVHFNWSSSFVGKKMFQQLTILLTNLILFQFPNYILCILVALPILSHFSPIHTSSLRSPIHFFPPFISPRLTEFNEGPLFDPEFGTNYQNLLGSTVGMPPPLAFPVLRICRPTPNSSTWYGPQGPSPSRTDWQDSLTAVDSLPVSKVLSLWLPYPCPD